MSSGFLLSAAQGSAERRDVRPVVLEKKSSQTDKDMYTESHC